MHLTEDVVKRLCKTDPATVEHFHIHWVHVDRVRPTSLLRCQCLVSLCLSHADLLKIEGKVLGRCVNLWWVDLSHNRLAGDALATSGIDEFSALGALDLGHNALGPESLAPASEIEVVRLTLAGNAGLGAGDDSYRRTALQRAPAAWVLDDHFVTAAEAASAVEAHEAAAALERKTSPPASPTSPTILEKRTLATLGDGDWNEASAGDTATKKHLARHRRVLANQPARPFLRDQYRLKNLVVEYETRCAALKSWASAEPRDDRRTGPRRPPNTRRAELCGLPTRARLDACVLLWASLQFAPLPAAMYKEALTILLAPHAGGAVGDVAALPPLQDAPCVTLAAPPRPATSAATHRAGAWRPAPAPAPPPPARPSARRRARSVPGPGDDAAWDALERELGHFRAENTTTRHLWYRDHERAMRLAARRAFAGGRGGATTVATGDTRGSDTFNLTQLFDDAAAGIEDDPGTGSLQPDTPLSLGSVEPAKFDDVVA
ncbi:hypothetical protein JL722_11940 [Aureococcus anophagefferens]|nr:hypothetical protein JL722_11940 [Aureococcus anophagefferens]